MQDEKSAVQETVTKMVNAVDNKDWNSVNGYFADNVLVDYSSMGGPKNSMKSIDLVDEWREGMKNATTHHSMSIIQVELTNETSKVQSQVSVRHFADGIEDWDIQGLYFYDLELQDHAWKITSLTFILQEQSGNLDFLKELMNLDG